MKELAWALVGPSGHCLADTDWQTEEDAWAASGCHELPEIELAKAHGFRAIRVRLFEVGPA